MRTYLSIIQESENAMKATLEAQFGDEDNYPLHYEGDDEGEPEENDGDFDGEGDFEDERGPQQMGDHGDAVMCYTWARVVVGALPGRAKFCGFWVEDNPAPGMARLTDGHNFALVDDRYIVDGWLKNIEGETDRAVFDLQDPADAEIIKNYYGDPKKWEIE